MIGLQANIIIFAYRFCRFCTAATLY